MADVAALRAALSLEEKAALTAGGGMLHTVGVERLGIPQVNVTDGPSGARGWSFPGMGGAASSTIPCGSAIGATWDPALAEALGALVGREARDRGFHGLLAPTMNLHRSPLAGRNFECYSEDPFLSGKLAAGAVRGVQSVGVFATIKHFVANDAEFERGSINSVVDTRALRELYLVPFEMAVREGGALALMTSYNRLNGRWLTEQPAYLVDLLRGEWGFAGLVMTDWFAVANTVESLAAGLDLEMPGPGRSLGPAVAEAVRNGVVKESDLDEAVTRLLGAFDRMGILGSRSEPGDPGDPHPPGPEAVALMREAAAAATVLLRNDGTLPLEPGALGRVAVLGPNAGRPCLVGGGSAQVVPHHVRSALDALAEVLGDGVELVHERGCEADLAPALVGRRVLVAPEGFEIEVFAGAHWAGEPVGRHHCDELRVCVFDSHAQGYPEDEWSIRVHGRVVPHESGTFTLALAQAGRARLSLDGAVVLDGFADPPPPGGFDFFGLASQDLTTDVRLEAGTAVDVVVEYARLETMLAGFRVGFRTVDTDALLARAVAAASEADAAVLFVGTSAEWETEGRDRASLALPGRQDELIRAVAQANPKTVVVLNAGAPVDLSWEDEVAAVLQCWFGGQEMTAGVADVLGGKAEPGGRLPTTIPRELRHSPSHDNFPGENGELRYGEGLFMGYRGYEHRGIAPRYPFGYGLSYTTFELGEPQLSAPAFAPGESLRVRVPVTNTGTRAGTEVVQCYVEHRAPRLVRPVKELKAFAKVRLEPGERAVATLSLDDRSFSYWDPGQGDWADIRQRSFDMFGGASSPERRSAGWQLDEGDYVLHVGTSCADIAHRCPLPVRRG